MSRAYCPFAILGGFTLLLSPFVLAQQVDIQGPIGSSYFGTTVTVLSNGNFVVTDPTFPNNANVGAVYLYDPTGKTIISTLTGTQSGDRVGNDGVRVLANGNFIVSSPYWTNVSATNAGAITWGSATSGFGVAAIVSATNSLVGSTSGDNLGRCGGHESVYTLTNGNYVIGACGWTNAGVAGAGAAIWGNGSVGSVGTVSASNALVGSTAGDQVGEIVVPLGNGNYVVDAWRWTSNVDSSLTNIGAVTWGNGTTGATGQISASNSLTGSTANDVVGYSGVVELSSHDYVVGSSKWNNGTALAAGAATWCSGSSTTATTVQIGNSLYGASTADRVGGITALSNGNYVVTSNLGGIGAATWAKGDGSTKGFVYSGNSLVSSNAGDTGIATQIYPLINGNYVVQSFGWNNNAGAVTWRSGTASNPDTISSSNSLVGDTASEEVGLVTVLTNGNYVVVTDGWSGGIGAVTWGDGSGAPSGHGVTGAVSAANSLTGSVAGDGVGSGNIAPLTNGNYVVGSPNWDGHIGAVTWADGSKATVDVVGFANSITGGSANDQVGFPYALANGNYVIGSISWSGLVGAVTWGNGRGKTSTVIGSNNSLVGNVAHDEVGAQVFPLNNGDFVVNNFSWSNGALTYSGAVTLARGRQVTSGTINGYNSVLGLTTDGGSSLVFDYDAARDTLIVGRPKENEVTLFKADELFNGTFDW